MTNMSLGAIGAGLILSLASLTLAKDAPGSADRVSRPNIVVILADDLGYGDLACYGHPAIKTPHLDRLAAEGMRFTDCYSAAPLCSPSRAGLLTGRTPTRAGIYTWIPPASPMHLRKDETTIAALLQKAGYKTCHVGKWHLNGKFNRREQPQPGEHGFDYWFSTQNNAVPTHESPINFVRNGRKVGALSGYSCQVVVDEAIDWLSARSDSREPFFLFVCFHETHEKLASPAELIAEYPQATEKGQAIYYANVTNLDRAVGRLLQALDSPSISENTLVCFTSDHGPEVHNRYPEAWRSHGTAGPLRGAKRHVYDGGIRVPGIVRWRGRIVPGQMCETPVCSLDLLPTFCGLAGAPLPSERKLDGASLVPLFNGQSLKRQRPLFWHYYGGAEGRQFALRDGDWKLVAWSDQAPDLFADDRLEQNTISELKKSHLVGFELYHISEDKAEQNNLADREPERLQSLSRLAQSLYREVIAEGPEWHADPPRAGESGPVD